MKTALLKRRSCHYNKQKKYKKNKKELESINHFIGLQKPKIVTSKSICYCVQHGRLSLFFRKKKLSLFY